MDLKTFHRFPDLPAELRQMIFALCIPRRVIRALYCSGHPYPRYSAGRWLPNTQRIRSELPRMILVNKEAYAVVLLGRSVYNIPTIPWVPSAPDDYPVTVVPVLANPKIDIIWLCEFYAFHRCIGPGPKLMQCLEGIANGPCSLIDQPQSLVAIDWRWLVPTHFSVQGSGFVGEGSMGMEACQQVFNRVVLRWSRCMVVLCTVRSQHYREPYFDSDNHEMINATIEPLHGYTDRLRTLFDFEDEDAVQPFADMRANFARWVEGRCQRGIYLEGRNKEGEANGEVSFAVRKEKELARLLHVLQEAWLAINGCFDNGVDSLVPFEMDESQPKRWLGLPRPAARRWDNDHPLAKKLLAQLPRFSFGFAVMDWEYCVSTETLEGQI